MFISLYKCLIRSHFDYAVTLWDPYILKLIDDIESVQRRVRVISNIYDHKVTTNILTMRLNNSSMGIWAT